MTAIARQQEGNATAGEACCRTLAVTPMRHKGLMGWRYDCKCNYMITLVTEPRAGIFGTLREWGVERSAEGRAVYDAWQKIEAKFPGVRATYNSIMPDHFHGIVYITVEGAAVLGEVVAFFAAEAERLIGRRVWCGLWRDSICLVKGQLHRQINYVLGNAKRRWIKERNPGLFKKVMGFSHWRLDCANETLGTVEGADGWDFRRFARDPDAEYWDLETGEEIAKPRKANQVQRAFGEGGQQAYDSKSWAIAVSTPVWTALGNPFLLDEPLLISVRISTATPRQGEAEREHYGKARFEWLNLAARAMGDLAMGFSRAQTEKTASVQQQGGGR